MNNLVFRVYVDSGLCVWVCRITRRHHWVNASYREQACTRCPRFRARTDQR